MSEDPLQLYPTEKWSEIEDVFKPGHPGNISVIMLLEMQIMLQSGCDHGCKVYCPYGNCKNGLVVLNIKKGIYELIIQCPSDDTSKLEDALKTTNIIDWEKEIEIPFAPKHVISCVNRVIENKNIVADFIQAFTFSLDKSSPLFNVTLPPGFSFDFLSLKHVDLLDSTWPHRYEGSNYYFELIIKAKLGYGLFKQKQLVSWALTRETGCLLHVFTLQEERRKGYGELVLKFISNVILESGKYVMAFCKADNVNAVKLYQKLNFQQLNDVEWCTLNSMS